MTAQVLAAVLLLATPTARAAAPLATVSVSPLGLEWQPSGDYEKFTLTVSGPGGVTLRREIQSGAALAFEPFGDDGKPLPDGTYSYELTATPRLDPGTRQALAAAHRAGDEAAIAKMQAAGKLPRGPLAQSGFFTIHNGALLSPDAKEERPAAPRPTKALTTLVLKDVVTPDNAIIQGSLCAGLDCVNNESFGLDTLRLKEANTRIKFDDTSTGTGFPNHDWQLTANDSASGGANKFSIEDITASTVPVTVTGSAPTNSIFVDSTGRVGFRTSTPVLDLHVNTSNTPALRLEQNNSGGFTAQTWDIAGNEANFFVRDVTGGSKLPFRIRPGAPTSSIDISASGNVGIGTASPSQKLDVECTTPSDSCALVRNSSATGFSGFSLADQSGTVSFFFGTDNANSNTRINSINNFPIVILTNSTERLRIDSAGKVGIGTASPANKLHVVCSGAGETCAKIENSSATGFSGFEFTNAAGATIANISHDNSGGAFRLNAISNVPIVILTNSVERVRFPAPGGNFITAANGAFLSAGGAWTNASSRTLKQDIHGLDAKAALDTLKNLDPVEFAYKADPSEHHLGFIAEDVPALVAENNRKGLSSMDIVAVLTKVVQEQQKTIEKLSARLTELEQAKK